MHSGLRLHSLLAAVTLATLGGLPGTGAAAQATGGPTIRMELVSVSNGKVVKLSPENTRGTIIQIGKLIILDPVAYDHGMAVFSLPVPPPNEIYAHPGVPWDQCVRLYPMNVGSVLTQGAVTPPAGPWCHGVTASKADALTKRFPATPGLIIIFVHKMSWWALNWQLREPPRPEPRRDGQETEWP